MDLGVKVDTYHQSQLYAYILGKSGILRINRSKTITKYRPTLFCYVVRILVTGGAGFIGKHLTRFLLEKGQSVTIFDNFSNSIKDLTVSLMDKGVKVIEGDITNLGEIQNAVKEQDIVIHLAAKISVQDSIKNPSETFKVNVDGAKNVLIACKKNGVKKLICASSAAVYGEGLPNIKLTENTKTNPISPYGQSKIKMEENIEKSCSIINLNYLILRFFNIYGIGQSDQYAGVITKFTRKISDQMPLEIFGDGLQTRDFVSIDDIVNSIYKSISNDRKGIYNIASGKTITIKELAEKMILISGEKLDIKYLLSQKDDIRFSQADISLAKKHLGYAPKNPIEQGLEELLE